MTYSWDELGGLALARQFPGADAPDEQPTPETVASTLDRIGPVQAQTARSPFLALAARLPGVRLETIAAAYEALLIVRGSNLRGTVHTSTARDHALLEAVTRIGNRALWNRTLRLSAHSLEEVWDGIEAFAHDHWRTPVELHDHLAGWITEHDPDAQPRLGDGAGRFFGFGHGGLVRRPLAGGWQTQGAPGYRAAAAMLGDRRSVLSDPDGSMDALVHRHLSCHGPSSRQDLSWWAGVGLRVVDASLGRLEAELSSASGPDGRTYYDLAGPSAPIEVPGVRLLPEFDALLCAYEPAARARFVTPEHHGRLWSQANGLILAPLLVDGRLTGYWRTPGTGPRRPCEVTFFRGTRPPRRSELHEPVTDLESAYGLSVTEVRITRE